MASGAGAGPQPPAVMAERPHLINLAYRLLGSLSEAEDAVQEAYLRWYALPAGRRERIESPAAWLTTVTSRICLDVLGSARARRERYVGEWVPEPVPGEGTWREGRLGSAPVDPADRVSLDESVSMAFLVVLESMTPAQRVAFILHDVFRYPFTEIARVVGRTPGACRQLASTARSRVRTEHGAQIGARGRHRLVERFRRALESGDVETLVLLLDAGATLTSDGGGRVRAARTPISGARRVAQYLVAVLDRVESQVHLAEREVNDGPGLVATVEGTPSTVFAFDLRAGSIRRIWAVRNPDKLRAWEEGNRSAGPDPTQ